MDRHNSYRPGPPGYDSRDSRRDYDRPEYDRPPPPRYDDRPPPPPDGDMFHFRGAASRPTEHHAGDSYRPGGHGQGDHYRPGGSARQANGDGRSFDFNFQANNGNAPSFAPTTDYPSARRGARPQQSARNRDRLQNSRGGRGGRGRGRGGWVPKRATDRELLRTERAPTPEQLQGMNGGRSRFRDLENASQSDSEAMDTASDSDDEDDGSNSRVRPALSLDGSESEGEHPRAKRARIHSPVLEEEEKRQPKWSNPDPYTVLPPPDETQTRKNKDVVKLIRKAKLEAAKPDAGANAASDFISLNFDDDDDNDNKSASESGELSPSGEGREDDMNAGQHNQNSRPSFSHLDNLHPDRVAAPPAPAVAAQNGINMALPAGRLDVWPPPPPDSVNNAYDAAVHKQQATDGTANARQKNAQRGKKRKHPAQDLGDIVEEWVAPEDTDPTPWLNLAGGKPSLHNEILDFYDYVRPRDFEDQVRSALIHRIQRAIQQRFPAFQLKAFGSFASGLYLPTADMDLVAVTADFVNKGYSRPVSNSQMHKFGKCLQDSRIAKPQSLTVVAHARIPIIKLVDNETGLRVDISFENNSGLTAQKTFEDWKQRYPAMPIIVSLIKQFLVMRGMSEVFSGGLGGYSVICLVVSVIRRLQNNKGQDWDQMDHLDHILMEFLVHYGEEFDRFTQGIQMEPWGYISKARYNPHGAKKPQPERLLIIDPNKYENDISGGSKNVDMIFEAFRDAYDAINKGFDEADMVYEQDGEIISILERVWGGNYGLFEIQRARLRGLAEGHMRPMGSHPATVASGPHLAPQTSTVRTEGKRHAPTAQAPKAKKRHHDTNTSAGTQASPIDLDGSSGDVPRYATRSQGDVGKKIESLPTSKAKNKPSAPNGPKAKADHKHVTGVSSGTPTTGMTKVERKKEKKKEKKSRKQEKNQFKDETGAKAKPGDASRARAFKASHPGVECPRRISREQYKDLVKKHGAGGVPSLNAGSN